MNRFALALLLLAFAAQSAMAESIGKKPGDTKGRWLEYSAKQDLQGFDGICIREIDVTIHWKKKERQSPIEEAELIDIVRRELAKKLSEAAVYEKVLDRVPSGKMEGRWLFVDAEFTVEPGSRAARYLVGMGAGKSKSILELRLYDPKKKDRLGLYHGYGSGVGVLKLAGGGAAKMSKDDIQENARQFAALLGKVAN